MLVDNEFSNCIISHTLITQPWLAVCVSVNACQVVGTLALGATNHWLTGGQPGLPANANKFNCLSPATVPLSSTACSSLGEPSHVHTVKALNKMAS